MKLTSLAFFTTLAISSPLSHAKNLGQRRLPPDGVLTESDKQKLLDTHNDQRSETALGQTGSQPMATNMIKLVYDDDIAATAKAWADRCEFEHDFDSNFGENLYVTGSTADDRDNIEQLVSGIQGWFEEHEDFTYSSNSCESGKACGHYTQNVWADTQKVGCGYAECPEATFGLPYEILLVCRYDPPGNFVGVKPYEEAANSASVASSCPSGFTGDSDSGLCVADGGSTDDNTNDNTNDMADDNTNDMADDNTDDNTDDLGALCKLKSLLRRRALI